MLSKFILKLVFLFLPTQLGLHFWPAYSRVAGIKIDYLSPTIYFLDILIILYLILSYKTFKSINRYKSIYLPYFLLVALNIYFAVSPINSGMWWIRNTVYLLFFLYLIINKISWSFVRAPLLISTIITISIQVLQTISQSSLGGIFYWFGERSYSSSSLGMARISLLNYDFVRAPSFFSHPNSLSGYLLVILYLCFNFKEKLLTKIIVYFGILLTFSKAALLGLLIILFRIDSSLLSLLLVFISIAQIFPNQLQISWQPISDRVLLLKQTGKIIGSNPLFGVGIGNYISSLAEHLPGSFLTHSHLQPVHNLPLLIISETGIAGLIGIVVLVKNFIQKNKNKIKIMMFISLILVTGLFDHYWWTLPQNKLILLLALALII